MIMGFTCREKEGKYIFLISYFKFELIRSAQRFEIGVVPVDMNIHYGGV